MEYKYGQMVLGMKAIGVIIRLVAKESSGMWMVMSLRVSGRMIRQMVMVSIFI